MFNDYTANKTATIVKAADRVYVVMRGVWAFDWIPDNGSIRTIDKIFHKHSDAMKYLEDMGYKRRIDDLTKEFIWYPTNNTNDYCMTTYIIKEFDVN